MAGKSPLSELREMNVRRQRETQNPPSEDVPEVLASEASPSTIDSNLSSNLASDSGVESGSADPDPPAMPVMAVATTAALPVPTLIKVEDLRKTSLEQLNIRIPAGFKEWLAEEAHRRRREGVTQQSLVTDALEAMIRSDMEAAHAV